MSFQENLRRYREGLGITGKEFASKIGINYGTYISYESAGKEPKLENLAKIAAGLHVSIDDLLGYKMDEYERLAAQVTRAGFSVEKSADGETVKLTPGENIILEHNLSDIINGAPVELSTKDFLYWAHRSYEVVINSDSFRKQYSSNLLVVCLNQLIKNGHVRSVLEKLEQGGDANG
ncbi:MAG: helix-turn-helix transcriptional regulator [Selenomonas ruminantium]|uniref:Helix-turn-helix transcriptional regulator n=1 Tax=Selenomonas ruminantium TaxID=971 RepID=A0A927ZRM3_SELRU|nr:helix-turn-helix transcriptional regulator [Selenomonas ruminantium]